MNRFLFYIIFFISFNLFSQSSFEYFFNKNEIATFYPANSQNVILKGIYISGKKNTQILNPFYGVRFYDVKIPAGEDKLIKILTPYLGKPITEKSIKKIKDDITSFYEKQRHPLVSVLTPDQDASNGMLQFTVIEAKLGKITIKENKWTKETKIRKEIKFKPNEPIDDSLLEQDIYWLNRNSFRQSYALYSPGEKEGTTDIDLYVNDKFPCRGYLGIDNLGNNFTGYTRLFGALNIGNLFGNQFLSYQFTTNAEFDKFMGHSVYYKAPLPWRHEIVLFGACSFVDVKYKLNKNDPNFYYSKGFNLQTTFRYDIPLYPWRYVLSDITCGFDFKRTNSSLFYGDLPNNPKESYANITQLVMGYTLLYTRIANINFQIEGFWSLGRWISDQYNKNYRSIRYKAKSRYAYIRSYLSLMYPFYKSWSFKNYLRWQMANQNLLPSEEYNLGGFDNVRGYGENEASVDHAIIYTLELHSPNFEYIFKKNKRKKITDKMDLFIFSDTGYGAKNHKSKEEKKKYLLASIGPGLRYNITPYLATRLEWGIQLHHLKSSSYKNDYRIHFSVIGGF